MITESHIMYIDEPSISQAVRYILLNSVL